MSERDTPERQGADAAPGDQGAGPGAFAKGLRNYLIGLTLAAGLTQPAAPFGPAEREARSQWHDAELARAWHYYSRRPSTRVPK